MHEMSSPTLESLSHTDLRLADPIEDVRGRKVRDRDNREVGKVDDVYIDPSQRRARFLSVKSGDVFGIGGQRHLIPVDAVTIESDDVVVNATTDQIHQGPRVDQDRSDPTESASPIVLEVYEFYAVRDPFWSPTYEPPTWH
jgi:sporulation protein YlmC with PRC-barrel domain